jgi:hypothetical protein
MESIFDGDAVFDKKNLFLNKKLRNMALYRFLRTGMEWN